MSVTNCARLIRLGQLKEAESRLRGLLMMQPDSSETLHMLGMLVYRQGRLRAALDLLRRAVSTKPGICEYSLDLATVLLESGFGQEALTIVERVLDLKPELSPAHDHHGVIFERLGRRDEAIDAFRKAVLTDTANHHAHLHLALLLRHDGQLARAQEVLLKACNSNPGDLPLLRLMAEVTADCGDSRQLGEICREIVKHPRSEGADRQNLIVSMQYDEMVPLEAICDHARQWASCCDAADERTSFPSPSRAGNRKIRVGYVSSHFRDCLSGRVLEWIVATHNRSSFEIFCYSNVETADRLTERVWRQSDGWQDAIGLSDGELEARIRRDEIDVLVDASGHEKANRLAVFARRPAPVQVGGINTNITSGLTAIDYRLIDDYAHQTDFRNSWFVERLVPMKHWFFTPMPVHEMRHPPSRKPDADFIFACLGRSCQISDLSLRCFAEILQNVPRAVLLLFMHHGTEKEIAARFRTHGIDSRRLQFASPKSHVERLSLLPNVDVVLDTFPHNSVENSVDAFWMGVPVLTLDGPSHPSRCGSSLFRRTGFESFVARTPEHFVEIATVFATQRGILIQFHKDLRSKVVESGICDPLPFVQELESHYRRFHAKAGEAARMIN